MQDMSPWIVLIVVISGACFVTASYFYVIGGNENLAQRTRRRRQEPFDLSEGVYNPNATYKSKKKK